MALPFHGKVIVPPPTPRLLPAHGRRAPRPPGAPRRPTCVWLAAAIFAAAPLDMAEAQPGIKARRPPQEGPFVNTTNTTDLIEYNQNIEHTTAGVPLGGPTTTAVKDQDRKEEDPLGYHGGRWHR